MPAQLEFAKSAKESALSAKAETERKSREFISEQRLLIEKLNGEKVCSCWRLILILIPVAFNFGGIAVLNM